MTVVIYLRNQLHLWRRRCRVSEKGIVQHPEGGTEYLHQVRILVIRKPPHHQVRDLPGLSQIQI